MDHYLAVARTLCAISFMFTAIRFQFLASKATKESNYPKAIFNVMVAFLALFWAYFIEH